MTVLLPTKSAEVEFEPIDYGGLQGGVLGGSDQRINRLGNRFQATITLPPMTPVEADDWAALLLRGLREGVLVRVPEPNTPKGSPGALLVNGGGQAGGVLAVDGGTPGHVIRRGAWFSILTGGIRYLHKAGSALQLNASGAGNLEVEPLLRVIPDDNSPIELAVPMMQGLIQPVAWSINSRRIAQGISFVVREAA